MYYTDAFPHSWVCCAKEYVIIFKCRVYAKPYAEYGSFIWNGWQVSDKQLEIKCISNYLGRLNLSGDF